MIICNSRKFIFIHINKTAGTSITEAVAPHLQWNDLVLGETPIGRALNQPFKERFNLYKHSTAREIRAVVGERLWNDYRTFAVLRDPIDRTLSLYRYLKRLDASAPRGQRLLRSLLGKDPSAWPATRALRESKSFSEFIRHPKLRYDPGFMSQRHFIADEDGRIIVDTLLRFESIDDAFGSLCRELGLEVDRIGHANMSSGRSGSHPVTVSDGDAAFLRAHFAQDYALLEDLLRYPQKAGDPRISSG
jgi:hypothetical protein